MKAYSGESEAGTKTLAEWKQGVLKHFLGLFVICCGLQTLSLFVLFVEYLSRLEPPKNPYLTSHDIIINVSNKEDLGSYYRHRLSELAPVWEEVLSKEGRNKPKIPLQPNAATSCKEINSLKQIKSDSEIKSQNATENIVKIGTTQTKTEVICKRKENRVEVVAEVHVPQNA